MKNNAPAPNAAERKRIDAMMQMGCALTWIKFGRRINAECHHITVARKRLGPLYTIPLSSWYHRGVPDSGCSQRDMRRDFGASLADGSKAFQESHGITELELWQRIQFVLGLPDDLPGTKILPRRLGSAAHGTPEPAAAAATVASGLRDGEGRAS